jgi:hypothetical protein
MAFVDLDVIIYVNTTSDSKLDSIQAVAIGHVDAMHGRCSVAKPALRPKRSAYLAQLDRIVCYEVAVVPLIPYEGRHGQKFNSPSVTEDDRMTCSVGESENI